MALKMKNDLIRLLVIGAIGLAVYFIHNNYSSSLVKNEGDVTMEPQLEEMESESSLPKYVPQSEVNPVQERKLIQEQQEQQAVSNATTEGVANGERNTDVLAYPQHSNNYGPSNEFQNRSCGSKPTLDCFPKDTVYPQELLPNADPHSTWNQVNPPTQGHLADRNFVESGHHYGINTQGGSLRNANLQIRSDPVVIQTPVGPWMQGTIDPDTNRRNFEIGGDY